MQYASLVCGLVLGLGAPACVYWASDVFAALKDGDVHLTAVFDPGDGVVPAQGAQGRLLGRSGARQAGATGEILWRALPERRHVARITLDRDGNGAPEYGTEVTFSVSPRAGGRTSVELGKVMLDRTGALRGKVRVAEQGACNPGALPPPGTRVVLQWEGLIMPVDGSGDFTFPALVASTYQVAAASPGTLSQVVQVAVKGGEEAGLDAPLCLVDIPGEPVPVQGGVVVAANPRGITIPSLVGLVLANPWGVRQTSQVQDGRFSTRLPAGLYALDFQLDQLVFEPLAPAWGVVPATGVDLDAFTAWPTDPETASDAGVMDASADGGAGDAGAADAGPGIVHCWPGDGSGEDVVGSNTATVNPDVAYAGGKGGGQAFQCTSAAGTPRGVVAQQAPAVPVGSGWTYDLWLNRVSSTSGDVWVLDRQQADLPLVSLHVDAAGAGAWNVRFDDEPGAPHTLGGVQLPANTWVHLALTRQGVDFTAYQDGQRVSAFTDPAGAAHVLTPPRPRWCSHPSATTPQFVGSVDAVRIWRRPLAAAEVLAISRGNATCLPPP